MLFDLAKLGDLDKPLLPKILSDPFHKITKHLLYLYSMESFIYEELNQASRQKDESKIQFYGAYAAALSYIIYYANGNKTDSKLKESTILYRGLKMRKKFIDGYQIGTKTNLVGFTSTSKNREVAFRFAFKDLKEGQYPVIF